MQKLIMYSAKEAVILKGLVAEDILKAVKGAHVEAEAQNVYLVSESLYMRIRVEIPFFQQQEMVANFFASNYQKLVIVEELLHDVSVQDIADKMDLVEMLNITVIDEPD